MIDLLEIYQDLAKRIDLDSLQKEIEVIQAESSVPHFWDDYQNASKLMQKMSSKQKLQEEMDLLKMIAEDGDEATFEKEKKKIEFRIFLNGPYDSYHAIFGIHAGQGGTEACDWAQMLYRMYSRFFENKNFKVELVDETKGEEAGIKSIVLLVKGEFAFGLLKKEAGTHRLVRLSPFNANNLRQTSFALVEVMPYFEDTKDVEINPSDLEWDFFRSGGKGGQNVNKVSTAVRVKHLPSGIVVTCQVERSQIQNREYALKLLTAKLWAIEEEKKKNMESGAKGEHKIASWSNQIRNYVLHPYHLVKDLRTGVETSKTDEVLNGELDEFIEKEVRL
jgi:peptide chain release factor 2